MTDDKACYSSPLGVIQITANKRAITSAQFVDTPVVCDTPSLILQKAITQLDEYFAGERKKFDLTLELKGTEFQKKVWKKLQRLPFGKTLNYKGLAELSGNDKAARATGGACNKNPAVLFIPCHRVVGNTNPLAYNAGKRKKSWLLKHEGVKVKGVKKPAKTTKKPTKKRP
jgi:methylated-DNA-[protein]-cysteine S-methyltransferase